MVFCAVCPLHNDLCGSTAVNSVVHFILNGCKKVFGRFAVYRVIYGSSYTATLTGDAALTCVNNKDGVPPTGLAQDAAPAVWLLAAGAALAVVCRRRREAAP